METRSEDCPFEIDENKLAEALYQQTICGVGTNYGTPDDARRIAGVIVLAVINAPSSEQEEMFQEIDKLKEEIFELEDENRRLTNLLKDHKIEVN